MKFRKVFFMFLMMLLSVSSVALAGDFTGSRILSIQAHADPSGFRARLGPRFKIGDVEIDAVLSNVEYPGDVHLPEPFSPTKNVTGDVKRISRKDFTISNVKGNESTSC